MRASYFVLVNVVLPITNTVKAIEVLRLEAYSMQAWEGTGHWLK